MSDTSLVFNLVARDRASQALGSIREKFSGASTAIGAAMGVGLGAAITGSLDVGAANDKLAAQLGLGPAEAAKIATVSSNVYKAGWGDSTSQVNDAIKGVYQNIGDTSKVQGGLEGVSSKVLALSSTFDQDLGGTTAAVGQMIKTGLATDANNALDILTKGFQTGGDKAGDLLDTMNEYGTQFRKMGINGATATGLISQGLKGGARDADLVADSLKEFSIRAVDGSKGTAAGFKALGLSGKQMASDMGKGGASATKALQTTLDKLRGIPDPVKRGQVAVQLFGTQAEDMGNALYSLDPSKAVKTIGDVSGAADKMAKTVGDNPKAALEGFQRKITTTMTDVGGKLTGFAMDHQTVFGPLVGLLGGVTVAVLAISAAQKVWAAGQVVVNTVQAIWNAEIWATTAAMLANPMTWIVIGIIALIAVIVLIATKTTWFQTAWHAMTAAVSAAWTWVWTKIKQGADLLVKLFMNFTLPGIIISHWKSIKNGAVTAWNAVVNFVKGIPGKLVSLFLNWTLVGQVIKHWDQIKSGTVSKVAGLIGYVKGIPGRITSAMGKLGSLLTSAGKNVVQGLWSGISSMGGWLRDKLIGWAKDQIPGPIAKALGIASPSKVTKTQGQWIARGLIDGMTGSSAQVKSAAQKLSDIVMGAMAPGASRNRAMNLISRDTAALSALADKQSNVSAKLKSAQTKLADLVKARADVVTNVKQSIMSSADVTQMLNGDGTASVDTIMRGLQDKVTKAKAFAAQLAALKKKGVDSDIIAEIVGAGVDGGSATAAALTNASASQIKALNDQENALEKAAGTTGNAAGDAMYKSGIQAAQGLVKGLASQEKAIEKQMDKIAKSLATAIKKALKIKSPSVLMADEVGAFIPPGVMAGVQAATPEMERNLQQWAGGIPDATSGATGPGARPRLLGASPQANAPVVIEIRSSGRPDDEALLERLRKAIRVRGGNAQIVLGQK